MSYGYGQFFFYISLFLEGCPLYKIAKINQKEIIKSI